MEKVLRFFFFLILLGCSVENIYKLDPELVVEAAQVKENTVIIYMNADNNLDVFAIQDLHEIEMGVATNNILQSDNNVLVYLDRAAGASPAYSVIFEVGNSNVAGVIDSQVVKILGERDSSDKATLEEVLDFSIENYPAKNYGLVFWSHGTGWIPQGELISTAERFYKGAGSSPTKSFGLDYTSSHSEMSIKDFELAISNTINKNDLEKFSYVIFDACYMGDIEVAFQLRNYSDYTLASQTEIMVDGLPYDEVMSSLLSIDENNVEEQLKEVVNSFEIYYSNQSISFKKTAQMSLIKNNKLEQLSGSLKKYLLANSAIVTNSNYLYYVMQPTLVDDYLEVKYDLKDFVNESSGNGSTNIEKVNFNLAFDEAIIYHKKSSQILSSISTESMSGINVYIPNQKNESINKYYKSLDWYEKSGFSIYFN